LKAIKGTIVMEAFSFIGANAVVLPNVTIGKGAVVAAGAVVTKDVAPFTLAAGTPARFVRRLDQTGYETQDE
jgi:tetrahydrodipicolinate N-acetyltransferase